MTDRFKVPPPQPETTQVSIFDIIQMRAALGTVTAPSPTLVEACGVFDVLILNFAQSLKGNPNG